MKQFFGHAQLYKRRNKIYIWLVITALLFVTACGIIGWLQLQQMRMYMESKQQFNHINKQIEKQQAVARKQAELEQELKKLNDLQNKCPIQSYITHISKLIPARVRLDEFVYTNQKIRLRGCACSLDQLTKFIRRLNHHELFTQVKLVNAKKSSETELSYTLFLLLKEIK